MLSHALLDVSQVSCQVVEVKRVIFENVQFRKGSFIRKFTFPDGLVTPIVSDIGPEIHPLIPIIHEKLRVEDHSVSKLMQHSPLLCLDERGIVVRRPICLKNRGEVKHHHTGDRSLCSPGQRAESASSYPSNITVVCSLDAYN